MIRFVHSFSLPIVLCAAQTLVGVGSVAAEPQRTNFVQILTDDQGWGDLGSYGHAYIQTPNIDRLAKEGLKLSAAYSASAVCSPSRAAILTGRTPYRNGVYRWIPESHYSHLPASEVTLPQLLRAEGYATAHFGKWHLSHFSEDRIGKTKQYENYKFGGNPDQPSMDQYGYDYYFVTGNVARPSHQNPRNFFLNGEAMGEMQGYAAQLVAEQFAHWLQEVRASEEPFFVTIWFHEPHGPIETDPRFMEPYEKAIHDASMRQYFGNVTQIDDAVGRIMQALEDVGAKDDTLVWYTSDNGPEGRHGYGTFNQTDSPIDVSRYHGSSGGLTGRKRHTHEGGVRVPGIIHWPAGFAKYGVQPGNVSNVPVIGSDVFPTMLEIAGIEIPSEINYDSQSIYPLLRGETFKREKPLYWRNLHYKFRIALREGDWKIVGTSDRTEFELYHLIRDPLESTDLSGLYPEIYEAMKAALIRYDEAVLEEGPDWWKRDDRVGNITFN